VLACSPAPLLCCTDALAALALLKASCLAYWSDI